MVSILTSLQTNDERQAATEALGQALRVGIERRPSLAVFGASGAGAGGVSSTTSTLAGGLSGLYGAAGYFNATHQADPRANGRRRHVGRHMDKFVDTPSAFSEATRSPMRNDVTGPEFPMDSLSQEFDRRYHPPRSASAYDTPAGQVSFSRKHDCSGEYALASTPSYPLNSTPDPAFRPFRNFDRNRTSNGGAGNKPAKGQIQSRCSSV